MGGRREKIVRAYTVARAWVRADPSIRQVISRQLRLQRERIAELGDAWGYRLERLGASYEQIRWVASPGPGRALEREARYRAMCTMLEETPAADRYKAFIGLQGDMPKFRGAERRARVRAVRRDSSPPDSLPKAS